MFPLTSNEAYIKSTGERSTLGKMLEEGGNEPIEAKLNDEIAARAALGAHNLLAATFASKTIGGIVFTANSDGTISVANGTVNAAAALSATTNFTLKKGTYIITLGHNPASITNNGSFNIVGHKVGSETSETLVSFNVNAANSATKVLNDDYVITEVYFNVNSGMVFADDVKYYPMIRLATDADVTYQPYAKTNVELTRDIELKRVYFEHSQSLSVPANSYIDVTINTFSLPTGYRVLSLIGLTLNSGVCNLVQFFPKNGQVRVRNNTENEASVKPAMELIVIKENLVS